jgi:UDP-N-acetylglucosamine--N-acetylmuramyl-(pentapeptide) pyrophosphoryl-undecaprenol N-acetylglucosamine transferase
LIISGNPIRTNLRLINRDEALRSFGLSQYNKTVLILGGSQGAKLINIAVELHLEQFKANKIQLLWQTGEFYYSQYHKYDDDTIRILPFIDNMELAYSAADLVVCRAGATTIAEVSALHLPVVFIPSSNVAANHQYKNAKSIVDSDGAVMITDKELVDKLFEEVNLLLTDETRLNQLKNNIGKFSKINAAKKIAEQIINLADIGLLSR